MVVRSYVRERNRVAMAERRTFRRRVSRATRREYLRITRAVVAAVLAEYGDRVVSRRYDDGPV